MRYDGEADCYICAEGRKLRLIRESRNKYSKRESTISHYRCEDCTGCSRRSECSSSKDAEKPKMLQVKKQLKEKRAASLANITTEEGIMLMMCRSIQVEGAFGLMKHDFGFRRFFSGKSAGSGCDRRYHILFKPLCRPGIEFGLFHFAHGIDRTCK